MNKTYYRLASSGKTLSWQIKVTNNIIESWEGYVDGALEYTKDVVSEGVNIGKKNETTPAEQALLMANRKIELKIRKGYVQNLDKVIVPEINDDFFNNPPRSFTGPKPKSAIEPVLESKLEAAGRLAFTHKWNGYCSNIIIGADGKVRIFSSTMDNRTAWFPKQVDEIQKLVNSGESNAIPKSTWIVAEAELDDNPDKAKEIFSSDAEQGVTRQEEIGYIKFRCFNLLYYAGKLVKDTWSQRIFSLNTMICKHEYISIVKVEAKNRQDAEKIISSKGYEGMVIWDLDCKDIPIKFGGAPSRSCGAWKLKLFKEADVLIISWDKGRGKLNDEVATLHYGAYKDGKIVPMGNGGSGLDEKLRTEIKNMKLPIVCEITYEEVTENEKFRLPVIIRVRTDKLPHQVLREDIK